jgi:dipeptidyl aminopeptidase/acylaminoacyl peptidase
MSENACRLCKNAVLHEFPDMGHGFTDAGDEHGLRPQTARNFERILTIATSWR